MQYDVPQCGPVHGASPEGDAERDDFLMRALGAMRPILFSVQKRLRSILLTNDSVKRSSELRMLAQHLGCSLGSIYETQTGKLLEEELVRRIQQAVSEERASNLWWVAVISAVASVVSALTALIAVYLR
jgi:hypothetical protein